MFLFLFAFSIVNTHAYYGVLSDRDAESLSRKSFNMRGTEGIYYNIIGKAEDLILPTHAVTTPHTYRKVQTHRHLNNLKIYLNKADSEEQEALKKQ